MTQPHPSFTPIRKIVRLETSPERAFQRFTAEMGSWWPLRSHSVGQADAETVVMEPTVGGRILERIRGGREAVWGTVTAWDPPRLVAFTWHPGRAPETAQDVELRFTADGSGTRVELEHSGFERLGSTLGRKARRGYPIGWEYVLGLFAEHRGPVMWFLKVATGLMIALPRRRR